MKKRLSLLLLFFAIPLWCQKEIKATSEFIVSGQVKTETTFTVAAIEKLTAQNIPNVAITNHLGEKKSDATAMKGVLIKELLKEIEFKNETATALNEFYLTFIASDGYKVVYSWNEIFNSSTGDHLYLVTEMNGEKLSEMNSRLLTITTTDFQTGRRYIKGLSKIVVARTP